uniref:Uncharacterized protein n=1 Tax=Polysiphonia sp. TaxID=1967842 RepID=A0A1Z1M3Y1_9FLOR|nr:hypothetical protein [Polysiphonia sp.]
MCLHKNVNDLDTMIETRCAIEKMIFCYKESIELLPRSYNLRKLQANLIGLYNLKYSMFGKIGYQR